jgi:Protein of unknown function (DUF3579)
MYAVLPVAARDSGTAPAIASRHSLDVSIRPSMPRTMSPIKPRQICIQGVTRLGKSFRPSDWSERLAGAMSCFRPGGGVGGISAAIGYSPYCFPRAIEGVKCVIVREELRALEPMAWDFVLNFARDNELVVLDDFVLPENKGG